MTSKEADQFQQLLDTIRELRVRCPWDREQTIGSTARHLLEEAYEVFDAAERPHQAAALAEELGDLFAQALFMTVLDPSEARLGASQVLDHARRKLVRRHPHVFGELKLETADQVVSVWQQIKRAERGDRACASALSAVGRALPALMRAEALGLAAGRAGMDWEDIAGVLAQLRSELAEVDEALRAGDTVRAAEEIGDALLALANAPRLLGLSAEALLRGACDKFTARFQKVEALAASRGLTLEKLSPDEVANLWREAKTLA